MWKSVCFYSWIFSLSYYKFLQNVRRQLANENVSELDMVRMVSLYALRYEKHSSNDVGGLLNMLSRRGVSEPLKKVRIIRAVWFPSNYSRSFRIS